MISSVPFSLFFSPTRNPQKVGWKTRVILNLKKCIFTSNKLVWSLKSFFIFIFISFSKSPRHLLMANRKPLVLKKRFLKPFFSLFHFFLVSKTILPFQKRERKERKRKMVEHGLPFQLPGFQDASTVLFSFFFFFSLSLSSSLLLSFFVFFFFVFFFFFLDEDFCLFFFFFFFFVLRKKMILVFW